ncbi:MAG TPA: hypothetical protein VGH27_05150 [Streptosporangiaceae bacterium]
MPAHGNLRIYQVKECGGVIHDGNTATFAATYAISPAKTITGS